MVDLRLGFVPVDKALAASGLAFLGFLERDHERGGLLLGDDTGARWLRDEPVKTDFQVCRDGGEVGPLKATYARAGAAGQQCQR